MPWEEITQFSGNFEACEAVLVNVDRHGTQAYIDFLKAVPPKRAVGGMMHL
jgi:hypothetical protein